MADEFETCVGYGLKLSKRIYYSKELPPAPEAGMSKSSESLLPLAVMVYAVVPEPEAVDNPDVPSYQPYVHGRCDPPAFIPLHMHGVAMEVECCLDHANVSFSGKWRLHCIKTSRKCDCCIAIPMGDQVGGGTVISVKVTWSQKLAYNEGKFCLSVPFSFPAFVNPISKKITKREKIMLNVNSGFGKEILCKSTSHALKELRREVDKMGFLYEAEVLTWSSADFNFSYSVPSKELFGGVFLQAPRLRDFDERQMFSLYLVPGNNQSMKGAVSEAAQWLSDNLTIGGGTNLLLPLKQALKLLGETTDSIPLIFLITDGAVEDERDICNFVKGSLKSGGSISPQICTFGIGIYCNHYFLQMLAQIGRGYFDSAYDADSVDFRMQRLFATASSVILANITMGDLEHLDSLENSRLLLRKSMVVSGRYNGNLPESIKINGTLADMSNFTIELKTRKAKDVQLDKVLARRQIDILTANAWLSESKDLQQKVAKMSIQTGVPSEYTLMILRRTDKGEKAPETILMQEVFNRINSIRQVDSESQKIIFLGRLGVSLGNLTATAANIPPGTEEIKSPEATEMLVKAASNCCSRLLDRCCCMCFIQTCSYMNEQCSIILSQLCVALACFECLNFCYELCDCA
ncbi:hypothetical protein GH714_036242 [Hevea brasiliensis]|uniref:VWFA domain-containing protein n=1 Tax=Hevea brasiliensis TaxID=3981 RepID=A0A6A6NEM4_HEVBR|nr:hypothetical protein GH714_036242 [Hevea brasiliensis]